MLAINGGERIGLKSKINWPVWDKNTQKELISVLDSGRWAISGQWMGEKSKCEKFEQEYANYNMTDYCVAFDHGSSSLVSALQALQIGPGDEVIVPALTWVACIISICNVNATPVVVDIDEDTYCISIDELKKAITSKTKAIMPVHLYGCMCNMDEIQKIAQEYQLYVIEDASHSHGSMWRNQYAGTMGDIGCFSFQQGKVLTCGEGGAALTKSELLYKRLQELRTNSRLYVPQDKCSINHMQLFESGKILGTNYCISEFQAAVLLDQIGKLEMQNRKKEKNAKILDRELSKIPGIKAMYHDPRVTKQSYYRYCIKVDNQYFAKKPVSQIAKALEAELGFVVEQPYAPLNKTVLYHPETLKSFAWSDEYVEKIKCYNECFSIAEKAAFNEGIIFHHSYLMGNDDDIQCIISAFEKVQKYASEL